MLGYKVRKTLHNIAKDETNADYKYWFEQGWLNEEKQYYYDTKIGLSKRITAGLVNSLVKPQFKKMFDDPQKTYDQYLRLESLNFEVTA